MPCVLRGENSHLSVCTCSFQTENLSLAWLLSLTERKSLSEELTTHYAHDILGEMGFQMRAASVVIATNAGNRYLYI